MRRLLVSSCCLVLLMITALPAAHAAKPVRETFDSGSANAFWYTTENVIYNRVRHVTWYIGVFDGSWGTWSDVYKETYVCPKYGEYEECEFESYLYGDRMLGADEFELAADLSSARIDAVYEVSALDENWEPISDPFELEVTTDWTGVGALTTGKAKSSYKDNCYSSKSSSRFSSRSAEAFGTVGELALGGTHDAWISSSTERIMEKVKAGCFD